MKGRPLRILQLTEAFGGGVFTSLTRLSSGLAARGHDVHLAFSRRAETPSDVARHLHAAVHLHELSLSRSVHPINDLLGLLAVHRIVREIDADVLHLHSSKAGVLGRIVARLSGRDRTTFYSPRGLSFLQEDHSILARRFYESLERAAVHLGATLVACSASERRLIEERLGARGVALVENAVDVESIPRRVDRHDGTVSIGIVGRITYARNSDLFAELSRRLGDPHLRFVWVGGGEGEPRSRLEQAGVRVTGWMSRAEALAAMSMLDIYLHPSRWEGMPVALIEAQVCGLPAVATDVVGNRDVIRDAVTGFICRSGDEMAARLQQLIRDPRMRQQMGDQARAAAVARFNVERLVGELETLYYAASESLQRVAIG